MNRRSAHPTGRRRCRSCGLSRQLSTRVVAILQDGCRAEGPTNPAFPEAGSTPRPGRDPPSPPADRCLPMPSGGPKADDSGLLRPLAPERHARCYQVRMTPGSPASLEVNDVRGAGPAPAAGRDAAGPAAGGATVDSPAATAAVAPTAQRIEDEVGPIDGWVTVAFTSVFSPFCDIKPAELARHRRQLSRLRGRHHRRVALSAAPQPRNDRAGRVGPRLPRGFRCRPPTAARSTRFKVSTRPCAASCCMPHT